MKLAQTNRVFSAKMRELRDRIYIPLAIALILGLALRIAAMAAVYPAIYYGRDMIRYARVYPVGLFDDCWMPAGYPFVLKALRAITDQLAPVIMLQHLAGLVIGLLGYALARRLAAPRAIAVATALPAVISGDLLFIEHTIATETLFTLLLSGSLLAVATGIARRSMTALALGSCLLGLSTLVRSIGMVLPAAFAAGLIVALWRSPRLLLCALLTAIVPAVVIVRVYTAIATSSGGWAGLSEMDGFPLYSRVAPFADCTRFRPPKGSEVLCETRPPSERPGPFWYGSENAPARKHFGRAGALFDFYTMDRRNNGLFRQFALEAIKQQPLSYLHEVAVDTGRYFVPSLDQRAWTGWGPAYYDFRPPGLWESEVWLQGILLHRYRDATIHRRDALNAAIGAYASFIRFNGVVLTLALGGSLIGIVLTRSASVRGMLIVLLATSAVLYLVPVLVSTYDYRYGSPAQVPLGWAAVLGGWATVSRFRHRIGAFTSFEGAGPRE